MPMKLGLGLHSKMISRDNFRFAKQAGCTHLVIHYVDRFKDVPLPGTDETCFGMTRRQGRLWSEEELRDLKQMANDEGLELEGLENFDPSFWYDVLLDGPRKQEQMEGLKTIIRRMGKVGIPIMGYNFSIAGVWGRVEGPFARGGAVSAAYLESEGPPETPIPHGQVDNIVYDLNAPPGNIGTVSKQQIWQRVEEFLHELVPVAETCGVRLAAHADDPPVPVLRDTARLIHQPHHHEMLLDILPSKSNALELCLGTLREMSDGGFYQAIDQYSRRDSIAYIHLRNVKGKAPNYREVFIDEGDIDVLRVLRILRRNAFSGVLIPDHAPLMTCDAPWHAGMAHALGYIKALLQAVESEPAVPNAAHVMKPHHLPSYPGTGR